MTATSAPRRTTRTILILAATLLNLSIYAQQATPSRTLTGTVTDNSHEPLRGAIVELQNPANNTVVTYLTDVDGRYIFKRLNSESDYRVWVVFRGYHTPTRSISKFDSHPAKVINFKMSSY
jgi:hypothetical protein